MKSTVIKFGLYGLLAGLILFGCGLVFGDHLSISSQEIIGYGSMVISLSFVFFGIKYHRDNQQHGHISFGKALSIGLLISILVGIGVALADYLYTSVINPDFTKDYISNTLSTYEELYSGTELETKKAELVSQMETYGGSGFMAFLMFLTVVIIGFIISLISALFLQKKH